MTVVSSCLTVQLRAFYVQGPGQAGWADVCVGMNRAVKSQWMVHSPDRGMWAAWCASAGVRQQCSGTASRLVQVKRERAVRV